MIWESQSPLIVMLTSLNEYGRSKCFQYWPEQINSPVIHHNIQVTLVQIKSSRQWIQREFTIKHLQVRGWFFLYECVNFMAIPIQFDPVLYK
jgi:protein tyrosine phosphatase